MTRVTNNFPALAIPTASMPCNKQSTLRNLAAAVDNIRTMFAKIAQNERREMTLCEQKYTRATSNSAAAQRSSGTASVVIAALGLVITCGIAVSGQQEAAFAHVLANQGIGAIDKLSGSRYNATSATESGKAQLEYQKLQGKHQDKQAAGSAESAIDQTLQAWQQLNSGAASSSGG
jgi:hypothetical protein